MLGSIQPCRCDNTTSPAGIPLAAGLPLRCANHRAVLEVSILVEPANSKADLHDLGLTCTSTCTLRSITLFRLYPDDGTQDPLAPPLRQATSHHIMRLHSSTRCCDFHAASGQGCKMAHRCPVSCMHMRDAGTTAMEAGTNGSLPSHPKNKVAELVGTPPDVGSDDWSKAKLSVVVVGASGMGPFCSPTLLASSCWGISK